VVGGERGVARLRVMGAIIMRWERVFVPFAIGRGLKRAEEGPRGGEDMIADGRGGVSLEENEKNESEK
jgi:hypothetical protein